MVRSVVRMSVATEINGTFSGKDGSGTEINGTFSGKDVSGHTNKWYVQW